MLVGRLVFNAFKSHKQTNILMLFTILITKEIHKKMLYVIPNNHNISLKERYFDEWTKNAEHLLVNTRQIGRQVSE